MIGIVEVTRASAARAPQKRTELVFFLVKPVRLSVSPLSPQISPGYCPPVVNPLICCRMGGVDHGIRSFRCLCPKGCASSSLALGTNIVRDPSPSSTWIRAVFSLDTEWTNSDRKRARQRSTVTCLACRSPSPEPEPVQLVRYHASPGSAGQGQKPEVESRHPP